MAITAHEKAADLTRLDAMVKHLKIGNKWRGPDMVREVTAACLDQVRPILAQAPSSGDVVAHDLAHHYCLKFEEIRSSSDIDRIEQEYLQRKRELGFAMLRDEILDPDIDALLFMRTNAAETDRDRWVAVLNLLHTNLRIYWNKFHELTHRITEPPQPWLPFHRNRIERKETVEYVIDQVAGELAFYEPLFGPLVRAASRVGPLTFECIQNIKAAFAPNASLLSTANAVVKYWPTPAICFLARIKGRLNNPYKDIGLRVELQGRNDAARLENFCPHRNMRVPHSSPAFVSHIGRCDQNGMENLRTWTTSQGGALPSMEVYTSATFMKDVVYCVMSMQG